MKVLLIIISLVVLISCDVGEIPLDPITSEREICTIPMGSNYMTQTYYNIENNQIVSQNNRIDWDIAFESKRDSNYIYLNSSKFVQVWLISEIPFDEPINLEQALWQWDQSCLVNGGTAIDNLSQEDVYYVIDLGLDENLEGSGFIKFKVINSDSNGYTFRYSSIDNSTDTTLSINKNESYNKIHFSFINNSIVSIEPQSTNWNLLFSSYTHIFSENTPYLVTGVLINSQLVSVACDTTSLFDEISINSAQSFSYSNCEDIIGYNWKTFDFESNSYTINQTKTYIVKNDNQYYKLRFLDFYNESGEKGYPQFEIQKL